jgi:hypothetical protein
VFEKYSSSSPPFQLTPRTTATPGHAGLAAQAPDRRLNCNRQAFSRNARPSLAVSSLISGLRTPARLVAKSVSEIRTEKSTPLATVNSRSRASPTQWAVLEPRLASVSRCSRLQTHVNSPRGEAPRRGGRKSPAYGNPALRSCSLLGQIHCSRAAEPHAKEHPGDPLQRQHADQA